MKPAAPRSVGAPALSAEELRLMRETAELLVRRRLALPAMLALETVVPLNRVGASMLHVLGPVWKAVLPASRIETVAALLERRDSIPAFVNLLDEAEDSYKCAERARRQADMAARAARRAERRRAEPR